MERIFCVIGGESPNGTCTYLATRGSRRSTNRRVSDFGRGLVEVGNLWDDAKIERTDRKRIVAYASVAHMNMTLVGLFSITEQGVEGALFQMLSHGLVAGALFMVIGVLYDRYHTRRVRYYGGVAQTMPRFASVFLFFTMANIALPGTSSFVGERMILLGIVQTNLLVTVRSATGMVLGGAYSLWLYNRVAYGNLKNLYRLSHGEQMSDLNRREGRMFLPLRGRTLFLGRYPSCIFDRIHVSCVSRVEHVRMYS
jgi:NADH-quinone oxidoreductase subunit M